MKEDLVSIIMPVYNTQKYIKQSIQSVIDQTYQNWELIIINDGSTDDCLDIINVFNNEKINVINLKKNNGIANARNIGIKNAKGKYVAFIDSDDIWKNYKLEKQIQFMQDKDIAFSFSGYDRINEDETKLIRKVNVPNKINYKQALGNTIILTSTVIIDIEKIEKNKIQMPKLKIAEDTATWYSILKTGIIAYGYNDYVIKYRCRKSGISSNKFKSVINQWKLYKDCEKLNLIQRIINITMYAKNAVMKRISQKQRNIGRKLKVIDVLDIFYFMLILPISFIASFLLKKKDIWIIEENPEEACDNGFTLFEYIRKNEKSINAYYVITKKSKDYNKVNTLGNVIIHRSLKHWVYYLNSKYILVTQKYANPSPAIFYILHNFEIIKNKRIFLQHGITLNDSKWIYYPRTKFRLFICGAKREYEYVLNKFGYPNENITYTGLARFDKITENNQTENYILIMPTWRIWIKDKNKEYEYFKRWNQLINNNQIIHLLEQTNLKIKLVLHKNMKNYKDKIKSTNDRIIIKNNNEVNIQETLKKCKMLITDYSSIAMDIGYIKKPAIYYQFDEAKYREYQLQEGYFSYLNDGFGDVLNNESDIINKIKYYINNNFTIENKYNLRIDKFFERRDENNCKRIVQNIFKINMSSKKCK
ncbi:MAG: CDP-glycerol glycerophosphotransferase family protein [Clostridia bacterium]|nr:CDP-glycerol glycerophosphotransferase family protein [Clostridia bacterium]